MMKRPAEGPRGGRMRSLPQIRVSVAEDERIRANWKADVAEMPAWERSAATLTDWLRGLALTATSERRRLLEGMTKP